MRLRVLIVDDHRLLRESLRRVLQEDPEIEVVGEAADGRAALALAAEVRPDVVILDVSMPELNGIDAARAFRRDQPDVKLLLLSMHLADSYVLDAVRLGVKGYLLKSAAADELKAAVRAVAADQAFFSPEVSGVLARTVQSGQTAGEDTLTAREREILQLLAEGRTVVAIARLLGISSKTVRNHRDNIGRKLGCHSMADFVRRAIQMGLVAET